MGAGVEIAVPDTKGKPIKEGEDEGREKLGVHEPLRHIVQSSSAAAPNVRHQVTILSLRRHEKKTDEEMLPSSIASSRHR